jgi:hypothetical protein
VEEVGHIVLHVGSSGYLFVCLKGLVMLECSLSDDGCRVSRGELFALARLQELRCNAGRDDNNALKIEIVGVPIFIMGDLMALPGETG